jgi:hypothetical protein
MREYKRIGRADAMFVGRCIVEIPPDDESAQLVSMLAASFEVRGGVVIKFQPIQARELARLLTVAADELEARAK